jgi:hypothetical protein
MLGVTIPCMRSHDMRILIYKRTHIGDPDAKRQFGNQGCMGRVRGFAFDAVIGVGGISGWPTQEGIAKRINWVGRRPQKTVNPIDPRGPLVSFRSKDFRLFEHQGPLLEDISPLLAKKVFGSRARFFFGSLSPAERKEAERLLHRILDLGALDYLQLPNSTLRGWATCRPPVRKGRCWGSSCR